MPAISVIIPIYNVEKYLRRCLDSVKNQTFADWEAICVNDGSPDNSAAILEEYAANDAALVIAGISWVSTNCAIGIISFALNWVSANGMQAPTVSTNKW